MSARANRPLRILQATHQGDFGGSTNSITNLSRGLCARGHEVFMLVRGESLLAQRFAEGPARVIPFTFPRPSIRGAAALARILAEHRIDVVNCHASRDRYMAIWSRLLLRSSAKVVLTRRNTPLTTGGALQSWLVMKGSDRIIAVSGRVKEKIVENGVRPDHVAVVHNGIPTGPIDAVSAAEVDALRRELAIPESGFVIGVVARLKDQNVLLEALRDLPADMIVLFLGIDRDERLEERARELGLEQERRYLGFRDRPLPYYRLFDVMVLPSSIEGFSLAILEAMTSSLPVIASDAGGNAEAIVEGETGFLFPPSDARPLADALRALHSDRARARAMGANARARLLENFTIERTVEKTERVYQELVFGASAAGERAGAANPR